MKVIEFQKIGLPHAHCIFILDRQSKNNLRNPSNIDEMISAEIPPESEPELRNIVLKHAIHNPCGEHNPQAVCMGQRRRRNRRRVQQDDADGDGGNEQAGVATRRGGRSARDGRGDVRGRQHGRSHNTNNNNESGDSEEGHKCLKYFPKPFRSESGSNERDYYICYRRRSPAHGGEKVKRKCKVGNRWVEIEVDNSWVVPYSPVLSLLFDCHMNAELCISRVGSVKYLFKYVCKGRDRVTVELAPEDPDRRIDEIQNFVDARYVSASEAIWRLLGFTYIDRHPPVVRLDVHLPEQQNVYFQDGRAVEVAARDPNRTKLLKWFEANQNYPNARHLTYVEFARCFSWQKGNWKPRAKFKLTRAQRAAAGPDAPQYDFTREKPLVLSRIYTVSPREGERFFLRTLLFHVQGATCFEDVRRVEGVLKESFREACIARGLLTDDSEWKRTLQHAFSSRFVPLTEVFATLLGFCELSDPSAIWEEFRARFITDIRHRFRGREEIREYEDAEKYVLLEIENYLQSMVGKSLQNFGLPAADPGLERLIQQSSGQEVAQSTEQARDELRTMVSSFNDGQRAVFDEIVGKILPGVTSVGLQGGAGSSGNNEAQTDTGLAEGRLFFLDAPGGTGKTFVTKAIQK